MTPPCAHQGPFPEFDALLAAGAAAVPPIPPKPAATPPRTEPRPSGRR